MTYPEGEAKDRLAGLWDELHALAGQRGRALSVVDLRNFVRSRRITPAELESLIGGHSPSAVTALALAVGPVAHDPELEQPAAVPTPAQDDGTAALDLIEDDWKDPDDPFAVPQPRTVKGVPAEGDPLVARAVDDLVGDWFRTGELSREAVSTLAGQRGLGAAQLAALLDQLEAAGVELLVHSVAAGYDGRGDLDEGEVRRSAGHADRDQLAAYLAAAGRIPLLTAEDEVRLGSAIRAGQQATQLLADPAADPALSANRIRQVQETVLAGRTAWEQLVRANLRLVVSVARSGQFARSGVELSDRIQDGNAGLLRAADKYDAMLGYKFSTYATWWIRRHIDRGIGDRGRLIRLPVHVYEQVKKLRAVRARLTDRLDRVPTLQELADGVAEDPGRVAALLDYLHPVVSLDAVVGTEGDVTLGDLLAADADVDGRLDPSQVVLAAAQLRDVRALLRVTLTERECQVVERRYGIGNAEEETLEEIAVTLGVTRERVRQIQLKAFKKLAEHPETWTLHDYLIDTARS